MSRYIDADRLIEEIEKWIDVVGTVVIGKGLSYYAELMGCIEDTPTADVVEAPVRCKYCKHNVANWEHDELDATDYTDIVCDYWMSDGLEPDSFCSRGERITDE